jgi:hypothetical protein
MTEPGTTHKNVARDSAQIGVQAGTVHGGVHLYTTSPDDPPEKKFEAGVRFLDGGMPRKAWQLINAAVEAEYVTNKVCFYWPLALVSGRTRHELSEEEGAMLREPPKLLRVVGDDVWAHGVRTIHRLLDSAQRPKADLRVLLEEFDELGGPQSAMILRHLEVFLEGPLEDQMWDRALTRAKEEQLAGDRVDRAWKFFHPDPAEPRVRPPLPPMVSRTTWILAVTTTIVFVAAAGQIGYLLAQAGRVFALLAALLSVAGGYVGARNGVEWHVRAVRRRAKDEEFRTPPRRRTTARPGGFAKKVDQRFDHYFAKYVPSGMDRQVWLAETAGIRRSLRDELVEIYRESRVGAEKISWLIRYLVGDVSDRRQRGTLWSYREELATPPRTRAVTVAGAAAFAGGGIWAVWSAVPADPLSVARSAAFLLAAGWIAAVAWLNIILERRRYAADKLESRQALARRTVAFRRWQAKLADKPDDREMAAWLDSDRKVLLDEALQHYRLTMSDVIAHAFIEAPTASTVRARVRSGPWRYAKYRLLVFLLTTDGVRQLTVKLDFRKGTFHDRHRTNYRYEAVAAVRVSHADNDERTFELALVNGQEISVQVIGPGMEELQQGENPGAVSEVTLDAAGLYHTLNVLEGIAAEGKEWIGHEHRRGEARTNNLTTALRSPAP